MSQPFTSSIQQSPPRREVLLSRLHERREGALADVLDVSDCACVDVMLECSMRLSLPHTEAPLTRAACLEQASLQDEHADEAIDVTVQMAVF